MKPVQLFFPPQRSLHLFTAMAYSLDRTLDGVFASAGFLSLVTDFPVLFCGYEPAEAAAIRKFNLDAEQRSRLLVQERGWSSAAS
jgi:hypothetical protein